ncbi:hypothetical protein HYFRA_00005972 [Hymenoscyphus fraxineus]|uniref:Uncharacterized protein n=1 Tax=Hymenoscyphus fraxineus TaxID=746836 RepID=A0A9N9KWY8_9HELO|nr:hypothetical protein HYFRA_00005972 [Hymenoscyphus fraxineus]
MKPTILLTVLVSVATAVHIPLFQRQGQPVLCQDPGCNESHAGLNWPCCVGGNVSDENVCIVFLWDVTKGMGWKARSRGTDAVNFLAVGNDGVEDWIECMWMDMVGLESLGFLLIDRDYGNLYTYFGLISSLDRKEWYLDQNKSIPSFDYKRGLFNRPFSSEREGYNDKGIQLYSEG